MSPGCFVCRDAEVDLVPVCRELGIGIVAYSPLGRGMLTGAISKPEDIPEGTKQPSHKGTGTSLHMYGVLYGAMPLSWC